MSSSAQLTINSTPQLVGRVAEGVMQVWVHAGGTMYFGGNDQVSTTNGFRLDKDDKYGTQMPEGNEIWAVAPAATTATLYVFTYQL